MVSNRLETEPRKHTSPLVEVMPDGNSPVLVFPIPEIVIPEPSSDIAYSISLFNRQLNNYYLIYDNRLFSHSPELYRPFLHNRISFIDAALSHDTEPVQPDEIKLRAMFRQAGKLFYENVHSSTGEVSPGMALSTRAYQEKDSFMLKTAVTQGLYRLPRALTPEMASIISDEGLATGKDIDKAAKIIGDRVGNMGLLGSNSAFREMIENTTRDYARNGPSLPPDGE